MTREIQERAQAGLNKAVELLNDSDRKLDAMQDRIARLEWALRMAVEKLEQVGAAQNYQGIPHPMFTDVREVAYHVRAVLDGRDA